MWKIPEMMLNTQLYILMVPQKLEIYLLIFCLHFIITLEGGQINTWSEFDPRWSFCVSGFEH